MNIIRSFLVSAVVGAVLASFSLQAADKKSGGGWQYLFKNGLGDARVVSGTAAYKVENGVPTADFRQSDDPDGFIGFQVHQVKKGDGPYTVQWRNVRLRETK